MNDAGSAIPWRAPRKSAALAAVLGWILPGLGQMYVGRPGRGVYFLVVVLATYAAGLILGDFRCVSYEREPIWFLAEALAAGPTAAVAWLTRDAEVTHRIASYDAGLLYCAVASLLNAVVVADALGVVDELDRAATYAEAEARAHRAEAAALLASEEAVRAQEAALEQPSPPPLPTAFAGESETVVVSDAEEPDAVGQDAVGPDADAPDADASEPPP